MDPVSCPFDRDSLGWGHQSYQNQGFVPRDGLRKFYSWGGRGKSESELPCDTYIQHKPKKHQKPKTPDLLNLSDYKKVYPFLKTLFK